MKTAIITALCLALISTGTATAGDIRFTSGTTQDQFRSASRELGMALVFTNDAPPEPLGITGFEVGVEASLADINKNSVAFHNDPPDFLFLPKIRVRKGLPFGIDVGVLYSNGGNSNVQLYGVEVSKAILEGGIATPALGIRGTYTKLAGVGDLDLQTAGIDLSIGKGILFLTPYAGAGMVWIDSRYAGPDPANRSLGEEKIWQPRGFAGVEITPLPFFRVNAEVEYAVRPVYSLKVGVGF